MLNDRLAGIQNVHSTLEGRWRYMTAFEIISIFIGILTLLCAFGSLIVALLAFLQKRKKRRK